MRNILKGSLRGHVCEECLEDISNVEVLFYLPYRKEASVTNEISNTETFRLVTKEEAKQRKGLFIDSVTTDKNGDFEFEINEKYLNADFDIDFVCGSVPPKPPKPKREEMLQFHITTISVKNELERQAQRENYRWEYNIAHKWWCYIRGHFFDAWVICGHLMNCKTNTPIANAKVTAMDADLLTDDNLGTVTTDANGHFRIDYSSADFKKTFLSPWINVETDPSFLSFQSGPDVYFKAELAGTKLIDETKADARKNVGYCLCVDLCSEVGVIPDDGSTFPSSWSGIGRAFSSSFGTENSDFDAEGYAGIDKHVLFSTIRFTGQAALKSASGNPIEYRFRVSNTTDLNNVAPLPEANFTKIVGVDAGLFVPSLVSKLNRKTFSFFLNAIDVYSHQSDFDPEGWFDVNHAIERTLIAHGLTHADLALYNIIDEDTLISMDTRALTNASDVPDIFNAGVTVPDPNEIAIEKFAIRFEIREVIDKPSHTFGVIEGNGKTLNSVIMNNNPIYRKLTIKELEESTLCSPISGTLHAKYTLYHPHLISCSLTIRKNSETIARNIADGIINAAPVTDQRTNNNAVLNNPPTMERCTYIVKLSSSNRKYNGDDSYDSYEPLEQIFFYEHP